MIDQMKLNELSKMDSGVPLYQKIIKLQEEAGEVAQEFLKFDGALNASKSATGDDLLEEVIDVAIVALDIINALVGDDKDEIQKARRLSEAKLNKWQLKVMNYPKG
jgi:NTP pyrophosphatase (non-canonical NTP hydrolase)